MNEITVKEPSYEDVDKLIERLPGASLVVVRYCLNTGKRLRDGAKTRTEQDLATKLMCEARARLNEMEGKPWTCLQSFTI